MTIPIFRKEMLHVFFLVPRGLVLQVIEELHQPNGIEFGKSRRILGVGKRSERVGMFVGEARADGDFDALDGIDGQEAQSTVEDVPSL